MNASAILNQVLSGESTDAKSRIQALHIALGKMNSTTVDSLRCCDALRMRSNNLDSLTSPASDASALMSVAASNLGSTLVKLKDARDKFETVRDCEPAIDRLRDGIKEMEDKRLNKAKTKDLKSERSNKGKDGNAVILTEQDVYAAADSMEILRDAFDYFLERKAWRSTPSALQHLERVHKQGVSSMCTLITSHLLTAGPAIQLKKVGNGKESATIPGTNESAQEVSFWFCVLLSSICIT
jgi:exocyst complex component 7